MQDCDAAFHAKPGLPSITRVEKEYAIDLLTEKGFSPAYGARFLKRHIDQKVKLPITNEWKTAMRFIVDADKGELIVKPGDVFSLN